MPSSLRRILACGVIAFASLAAIPVPGFCAEITKFMDEPDAWFNSDEATTLLTNILSWQKPSGGWWKQYDIHKARDASKPDRDKGVSIFDNDATITEMRILARAFRVTQKPEYRAAFDRAMKMTLDAQYAHNGGWPQEYPPPEKGYPRQVTFNDDAMVHILSLMRDIGESRSPDFAFIDDATRTRCGEAFTRGLQCVLDAQIRVDGKPTVWCAQYDDVTLKPAKARAYELPSFSGGESRDLTMLLMSIENPSDAIKQAVHGAAQWYEDHKIVGVREERIPDQNSPKGYDVRHVADANAEVRWARFYDLETGKPYFCGRDGVKRDRLSEVELERRAGYAWFRAWGKPVLEKYPDWAKQHGMPELKPSAGMTLPL
jgi:PelA/Pel-15E family pectate lyase